MFVNTLTKNEKKAFLEIAHIIAKSNGYVDEKEQALLDQYAHEMYIIDEDVYQLQNISLEEVLANIESEQSKRVIFLESIALAFADGIYHEEQRNIIKQIKDTFGFSDEIYKEYKQWVIDISKLYVKGFNLVAGE
ncbi:TerB family tellurite resistance protein [Alkaliphilus pronyensis]|uniref:TerB family tellurite resistance protein n=1 Tax=Alkaliphilus pronyensis TaxID=1482732 RepID=A0A6I0F4R9_9FIRM|nr:TerB family tellurite resistance protein [Alkaliphilus pronyensis]KAB3534501.1 TerB family tellurite resistance protein [Alkaliphilus pronyensis]